MRKKNHHGLVVKENQSEKEKKSVFGSFQISFSINFLRFKDLI
jgi:hypothetical protein